MTEQPLSPAITILAEQLLASLFGVASTVASAERIGGGQRATVYRLRLRQPLPDGMRSVMLKQVRGTPQRPYTPDIGTLPAWTFFNDWASLQCLGEIDGLQGIAPRFYAGDRATGVLLMEDLGTGMRLDHALLGSAPTVAEAMLLEYAALHGRLHATMIGHEADYLRWRTAFGPHDIAGDETSYDWLEPTFATMCATLDSVPTTEASTDLAAIVAELRDPGPFLSFTQGDNCPDNCLRVGDQLKLIDFEGGRFTHALRDGVYSRMLFPTCWCVAALPATLPQRMEQAYRAALARGCPVAADDRLFARAVCAACVFWILDWCHTVPLAQLIAQDWALPADLAQWQLATGRQRILSRMEIVAKTTAELGQFEALGAVIAAMCARLRELWPAGDQQMPLYPPFRI